MTGRRCQTGSYCLMCWAMIYLPRWLAEPLLRYMRWRKPYWWASRQRLYKRLWLGEQ